MNRLTTPWEWDVKRLAASIVKEAQASVLERHLIPSVYPNHAQRVVGGSI